MNPGDMQADTRSLPGAPLPGLRTDTFDGLADLMDDGDAALIIGQTHVAITCAYYAANTALITLGYIHPVTQAIRDYETALRDHANARIVRADGTRAGQSNDTVADLRAAYLTVRAEIVTARAEIV